MTAVADPFSPAWRAMARSRRSRRWMLRGAILMGAVAVVSLALPIAERRNVDAVAVDRSRRVMSGAAWHWQGLVAAGTPPGEATEIVSDALHAHIVRSHADGIDIPFLPKSDADNLHDSFQLNPFVRGAPPRTSSASEQREHRESATRVAVLATAIHRRELDYAMSQAQRHLTWGAVVALIAAGVSGALFVRWRQRAKPGIATPR